MSGSDKLAQEQKEKRQRGGGRGGGVGIGRGFNVEQQVRKTLCANGTGKTGEFKPPWKSKGDDEGGNQKERGQAGSRGRGGEQEEEMDERYKNSE